MGGANPGLTSLTIGLAILVAAVPLVCPARAVADEDLEFSPSINDFGSTGLMQMPNARVQPDGEVNLGVSHVDPYTRGFFTIQILPWLEGTFRYTNIGNRLYSNSRQFSGTQDFKDRGVDLKIVMLEETKHFPQIALQLRDMGGTTLFGSEFLVASRRYYNWDFTLGVAWGNGGSRGHVKNPVGWISSKAKEREGSSGAGNLGFAFFRGQNIAFFGGVEYITPIDGLRLKVEYDGNDYNNEPRDNEFEVNLPVNFGVEYDLFSWLRIAAAFERGRELMIRGNLHSNFMNRGRAKIDRPPPKVVPREEKLPVDGEVLAQQAVLTLPEAMDRTITVERLFDDFERLGLTVSDIEFEDRVAILRMPIESPRPSASALATAALQAARAELNGPVDTVRIIATKGGTDFWEISLEKEELIRSISLTGSPIALVEPPDPRWLGLFPDEAPTPAKAAAEEEKISKGAIERIAADVFAELKKQGFMGERFDIDGRRATVHFSQTRYRNPAIAVGRGARAVAAHLPPEVEQISVVLTELGVPISKTTIMRSQLEKALQDQGSAEEIWQTAQLDSVPFEDSQTGVTNDNRYPRFDWSLTPQVRTNTGGPDRFIFYQLYARAGASVELADGLSVSGAVGKNIYNNFDSFKLRSDSKLPRVRSDIRKYLRQGDLWIDQLHVDYITKLTPEIYARASAGIFELMFTGIGGEVLYRPEGKRWAIGLDANYVYQRDFDGGFKLQNYDVVTGHLSYYHRWPFFGIQSVVRAGHYLAKDWGATIDLSRTFESGVTFGVFATKTDVSPSEFGEGSFDKGFYISMPLDIFLSKPSRRGAAFLYRPLTRDGGQFLAIPSPLYGFTGGSHTGEIGRGWDQLLD